MAQVLIAYNNDTSVDLHDFFESCGDDVRQYCYDHHIEYTTLFPPNLTENNVMSDMEDHEVCFVASHGDPDGITNENGEEVISTRTTNYNLQNKVFYSVACYCGINLFPHLQQVGVKVFVGYTNKYRVKGDFQPFLQSALTGIKCLLNGANVKTAREEMLRSYDEQIDSQTDFWIATKLLQNKEALVFDGDEDYHL